MFNSANAGKAMGVDTVSAAFQVQREDMLLCRDLMGGTKAMLAAGERYIPQEDGEDRKSWQMRLNRAILFNVYKRTLRYAASARHWTARPMPGTNSGQK